MRFVTILIFGLLAGCFALLLELAVMTIPFVGTSSVTALSTFSFQAFVALLIIAFIEEMAKYIFLLRYTKYAVQEIGQSLPSLVFLAILFGLGFFSLELWLSLENRASFSLFVTLRTLLLHTSTSLLFISFIFSSQSQVRSFFSRRSFWLISGAIIIHLAYNITLLLMA